MSHLPIPEKLVFVDIETTGLSPVHDRITEIGILVYENEKLKEKFSTLVNPEKEIPPYLVSMTGISNEMVKDAPLLKDIQKDLRSILDNGLFIAHNAQFDYGFIKAELMNLGDEFDSHRLCTAMLSRNLYPQHRKHNLDEIMLRTGLECKSRHRAFDDALLMAQFYTYAKSEFDEAYFKQAFMKSLKIPEKLLINNDVTLF